MIFMDVVRLIATVSNYYSAKMRPGEYGAAEQQEEVPVTRHIMLAGLCTMLVHLWPAELQARGFEKYKHHTEFDHFFSKYSKRFFGVGFDWNYFKAQAIAESNLNPGARSHVGAQGIMQIMPRTYEEISRRSKFVTGAPTDPRWNIAAGIWYNKQHFDYWHRDRTLEERLKFMYGSYNTGRSNLLKAQRYAIDNGLNPRRWESMQRALPPVTGRHSRETLNYVERIFTIKEALE